MLEVPVGIASQCAAITTTNLDIALAFVKLSFGSYSPFQFIQALTAINPALAETAVHIVSSCYKAL